jgi:hypothetical protein
MVDAASQSMSASLHRRQSRIYPLTISMVWTVLKTCLQRINVFETFGLDVTKMGFDKFRSMYESGHN